MAPNIPTRTLRDYVNSFPRVDDAQLVITPELTVGSSPISIDGVDAGTAISINQSNPQRPSVSLDIASEDEAEAGELNVKGMTPLRTRQAMDTRVYSVDSFRVTGDSDTTVIQRALDAVDEGTILALSYEREYDIEASITQVDKGIIFRGNGAKLIQRANTSLFNFRSNYSTPVAITAIDYNATYDFSDGAGVTSNVTKLTWTGTPPKVGDVFKIISDDALLGSDPAGNERRGEFARVGAVSGQDVYTNHRLRDTYTTNVRAALINMDRRLSISDLRSEADEAGQAAGWNTGLFVFEGWFMPSFSGLRNNRGYGSFLSIFGCLGARGWDIGVRDLMNDPSNLRYGYGINEGSSELSSWSGLFGTQCRHLYTTSTNATVENDTRPYRYGRTAYSVVANSTGLDCDSAFDTHSDAWGVTFANCTARGSFRGEGVSGAAFQLRGYQNRVVNCAAYGARIGLATLQQYTDGTNDNVVDGFHYEGIGTVFDLKGDGLGERNRISLDNITARASGAIISGSHAEIKVGKLTADWAVATDFVRAIDAGENLSVEIENLDLDLRNATASSLRVARNSAGASITIKGGRIRNNGSKLTGIVDLNNTASSANIGPVEIDDNVSVFLSTGSAVSLKKAQQYLNVPSASAAFKTATLSSGALTALELDGITSHVIIYRAQCTAAGCGHSSIAAGAFNGQVLVIVNRSTSTHPMIVSRSSGGLIDMDLTQVLMPGQQLMLTWQGSSWIGGTPANNRTYITTDYGDTANNISPLQEYNILFDTPLTADRVQNLPAPQKGVGLRFVRGPNATGDFDLIFRRVSTDVKTLTAAGQWCEIATNNAGDAWMVVAAGSL